MKVIVNNKKAFHDYEILEKFEAGIVLKGSETKALRMGRGNLKDSFVRIINSELFLMGAHISFLDTTNPYYKPDEKAPRKLLMHKKEIDKLHGKIQKDGFTIVALSLYLNNKNIIKVKIALAKGKTLHDKRETLKRKTADKDAQSAMANFSKGKI
ncbi:MAG: SsrA-binding protein SmpB [Campylobacter sp.]|nr:SsrA-binding protein SmpB [Campylobacter sp.]